jgi:O-antigen ligase
MQQTITVRTSTSAVTGAALALLALIVLPGAQYFPALNVAMNVLTLVLLFISLQSPLPIARVALMAALVAYWSAQAVISGMDPSYLRTVAKPLAMFWIGAQLAQHLSRSALAVVLALAVAAGVAAGIAQATGMLTIEQQGALDATRNIGDPRPGSFFGNANRYASSLCAAVALLGFLATRGGFIPVSMYLISVLVAAVGISMSVSRAGILFFAFGMMVTIWHWLRRKRFSVGYVTAVVLLPALISLVLPLALEAIGLKPEAIWEFTQDRFRGDASSGDRKLAATTALAIWDEHPVLGNGWNAVQRAAGIGAHNQLLEILADYGVVGAIGLLLFVGLVRSAPLAYLFAAIGSPFLFSHNFIAMTEQYLVAGLLVGLANNAPKKKSTLADSSTDSSRLTFLTPRS